MATGVIDKEYVSIKVSKKIGPTGIKRVKEFVKSLEADNAKSNKVSRKMISELSREINSVAWDKLKQERGFNL